MAFTADGALFPDAVTGGPTLHDQSITVFPLLQTAVTISPGEVAVSSETMSGGATLAFDSLGDAYTNSLTFDVANPALAISNTELTYQGGSTGYEAALPDGGNATIWLNNLDWSAYGFWDVKLANGTQTQAAFVTGYRTPVDSVPVTGTATFNGFASAEVYTPQAGESNSVRIYGVSGDATLQANFASGAITGNLTNMVAYVGYDYGETWNNVSLVGAISGGNFSGTSAASSAPSAAALSATASGTFRGVFFGPTAQELGAVWTLSDGTSSAIGIIGATSTPDGP